MAQYRGTLGNLGSRLGSIVLGRYVRGNNSVRISHAELEAPRLAARVKLSFVRLWVSPGSARDGWIVGRYNDNRKRTKDPFRRHSGRVGSRP